MLPTVLKAIQKPRSNPVLGGEKDLNVKSLSSYYNSFRTKNPYTEV